MNEETKKDYNEIYIKHLEHQVNSCRGFMIILSVSLVILSGLYLIDNPKFSQLAHSMVLSDTDNNMTNFAMDYVSGTYGIRSANILSDWIHNNIKYKISGTWRPASEVYYSKEGVCRDYAILLVSFMKSLGYSGEKFTVDGGNHAIVKIYDADGYFFCDPTNGSPFKYSGNSLSYCWRPF